MSNTLPSGTRFEINRNINYTIKYNIHLKRGHRGIITRLMSSNSMSYWVKYDGHRDIELIIGHNEIAEIDSVSTRISSIRSIRKLI